MTSVVRLLGGVVVPDIPALEPYSPSALIWAAVAVALVGLVGVVGTALAAPALVSRGARPMRGYLVAGAVLVVGIGAAALVQTLERNTYESERDEHWAVERAAQTEAAALVEELYGVDLPENPLLPVAPDEVGGPDEVVLPDGSRTDCFYGTLGGVYELRCGGDTWDASEPLAPLEEVE